MEELTIAVRRKDDRKDQSISLRMTPCLSVARGFMLRLFDTKEPSKGLTHLNKRVDAAAMMRALEATMFQ